MKRIVALLTAALLLTSAVPVRTAAGEFEDLLNAQITLTKVDTMDANIVRGGHVTFYAQGIEARTNDGRYQILNYRGVNALGESYDKVKAFDVGIWLVYQADKGINNCGLVQPDGTVLIPVSAASIRTVGGQNGYDPIRYLEVVYATEEVSDEDDAFLYATDVWNPDSYTYEPNLVMPGEGEKPYAGYSRYYDLQRRRFVPGLQRTSRDEVYSVEVVGDKLFFDSRHTVYDANGAVFAEVPPYETSASNGSFVIRDETGLYTVYDSDMRRIAAFELTPSVYMNGRLFGLTEDDTDRTFVVDRNGVRMSDLTFEYALEEYGSFLYGRDAEGYYSVMDHTGKLLIDAAAGVDLVGWSPMGFLKLGYEDGSEGLLYPDGTVVKGAEVYRLLVDVERADTNALLVLKDKAFTLEFPKDVDDVKSFLGAPFLFAAEENGKTTLYNIVTGEALLTITDHLDAFQYSNGYLYVQQGDVYDIYRVDVSY